MSDWIEGLKLAGSLLGVGALGTIAKLYHGKVVEGKDAEIARIRAELLKAEQHAKAAADNPIPLQFDLARLRRQLTDAVEQLARDFHVQAASLYIPVFNARDDGAESPRGFAFVAAYNVDPAATEAILKIKLVEAWTIVGACWTNAGPLWTNELQSDVRHVVSYDKYSKFVPYQALALPVSWQGRQVGVLQVFNKMVADTDRLDVRGFSDEDVRAMTQWLATESGARMAQDTHLFLTSPDAMRFLGLQGELNLENAVIMHLDLTGSSTLYGALPLIEAVRLISRFNEHVYKRIAPFAAVVERFNGDGTMLRFHYGGIDTRLPSSNPAYRAVCAAADLLDHFEEFKALRWNALSKDGAAAIKLRISIALGPVISTNIGPRQFQVPTVMGPCVNRSAKMVAHAPRNADVVLVDENLCKALIQVDKKYGEALHAFEAWPDPALKHSASLKGYKYFTLDAKYFYEAAARTLHG